MFRYQISEVTKEEMILQFEDFSDISFNYLTETAANAEVKHNEVFGKFYFYH